MSKERSLEDKVSIFKSRFEGRPDVFNIDKTPYDQLSTDPTVKVKKREWLNADKITGKWLPLTDDDIKKHITGEAPIAIFQKLVDDNIKFAVVDFDHPWDYSHVVDVQSFVWKTCEVPCYIAKSSRKGWHLIFFFKEWTDLKLFTSFWSYVVQETMIDRMVKGEEFSSDGKFFLYPEVFPRPGSYGDSEPTSLTCGAIKPPMVEPRMAAQFNAFHKEFEARPHCVLDQWEYLANSKLIESEWFSKKLEALQITIVAPTTKRKRAAPKTDDKMGDAVLHEKESKPKGSFEKVLRGCAAIREAYEFKGRQSHHQRLALGIVASNCKDGTDYIMRLCDSNPENWQREETEKAMKYLSGSYAPYTCEKLQSMGVCHKGIHPVKGEKKDHCLEPKMVEGEAIPPSPYRFAVQRTPQEDVTFAGIRTEVLAARELMDGAARRQFKPGQPEYDNAFAEFRRALVNGYMKAHYLQDHDEQDKIRMFLDHQDYVTKVMLKEIKAEAKKKLRQTTEQRWLSDTNYVTIHGRKYRLKDHHAYVMVKFNEKEGVEEEIQLTNFIVRITTGKLRVGNLASRSFDGAQARTLSGYILFKGSVRVDFHDIPTTDFESPSLGRFYERLANLCEPGMFTYEKRPDDIRNCIKEFNRGTALASEYRDVLSIDDVGWNGDIYLTSNAYVSAKNGPVSLDDKARVALSKDESVFVELNTNRWKKLAISSSNDTKAPAFEVVSEDRLRGLMEHFLKSFLKWHQPEITYLGAGFTLAACLQRFFPQRIRSISPSLFFVGEFEGGKSEVIKVLQNFYGPYEQVFNWASVSEVNLLNVVHMFKDMVVGIDDYKKSTTGDDSKVIKFIQVVYDRYGRGVHDVYSGETKESRPAAGLFLMGGEDIFESEPSAATRCIFVDFNKYKRIHEENVEEYNQVQLNRKSYSAITAHLINWALKATEENPQIFEEWYQDALNLFGSARQESSNATRIINNVSLAHMGFRALLTMADVQCQSFGQEAEKPLMKQHMIALNSACRKIIDDTLHKLREDKASTRFLKDVVELLISNPNQFYIEGHGTRPNNNVATRIGWVGERTPDVVNLIPEAVVREICRKNNVSGQKKVMQTQRTIGFALMNDGYLEKTTPGREPYYKGSFIDPDTKQKSQPNVFAVKKSALFSSDIEVPTPPTDMVDRAKEALAREAGKHDQRQVRNYAPGASSRPAAEAGSEV